MLIPLPEVSIEGSMSLEQAMGGRRSVRVLREDPLTLTELSQLLWAGQGVTEPIPEAPSRFGAYEWRGGLRTTPSAGALYPLELYALVGNVEGLERGLYRYVPEGHALAALPRGDLREGVWGAALRQVPLRSAPLILVVAAVEERVAVKYGARAARYVHFEVGAATENVYLQAESLGLGTVFMGAFQDEQVKRALGLPSDQEVLAIMPVGRRGTD